MQKCVSTWDTGLIASREGQSHHTVHMCRNTVGNPTLLSRDIFRYDNMHIRLLVYMLCQLWMQLT